MILQVYTDGSIAFAESIGGWAFCSTLDKSSRKIFRAKSGFAEHTTGNRMEITAVIKALNFFIEYPDLKELHIHSDSEYVVQTMYFNRIETWKLSGWKTSVFNPKINDFEDVKNRDLWEELHEISMQYRKKRITLDFHWIKGHAGHYFNEYADRMAVNEKKQRLNYARNKANIRDNNRPKQVKAISKGIQ